MKRVVDFCDAKQRRILDKIGELAKGFYEGNDNTVTYALTGLLSNLTNTAYNDPHYLKEKLEIIISRLMED